jgi:hypothetical protein
MYVLPVNAFTILAHVLATGRYERLTFLAKYKICGFKTTVVYVNTLSPDRLQLDTCIKTKLLQQQ